MSQDRLTENKAVYLKDKSDLSLEECFRRCTRSDKKEAKSITNRQHTCICSYISIKNIAQSSS